MKSYGVVRLIVSCVFSIASFLVIELWAELDMYVYNVGQANCILVTADIIDPENSKSTGQKNAIFFDTGVQKCYLSMFSKGNIAQHISTKLENVQNIWFVLTHTDDDHVNVFQTITETCLDKIRGVIVGTVDIGEYGTTNKLSINDINSSNQSPAGKALAGIKKKLDDIVNSITASVPISVVSGTKYYTQSGDKWQEDRATFNHIASGMNDAFGLCGVSIDFLCPEYGTKKKQSSNEHEAYSVGVDANAASIVTKLTYISTEGEIDTAKSILLTGDAPGKLFNSICRNKTCNNIDKLSNIGVFVCPHHGSITKSASRWLGELCTNIHFCAIVSSSPCGPDHIPEVSCAIMGRCMVNAPIFDSHMVECSYLLRNEIKPWNTQNPIFTTCSAGICYHINIVNGNETVYDVPMINKNDMPQTIDGGSPINEEGENVGEAVVPQVSKRVKNNAVISIFSVDAVDEAEKPIKAIRQGHGSPQQGPALVDTNPVDSVIQEFPLPSSLHRIKKPFRSPPPKMDEPDTMEKGCIKKKKKKDNEENHPD